MWDDAIGGGGGGRTIANAATAAHLLWRAVSPPAPVHGETGRQRLEVHGGYDTCTRTATSKQNTECQHGEPQVHQNIHQTPFAARSRRIHGVLGRSLGYPRSLLVVGLWLGFCSGRHNARRIRN